jgi:hypothetical protein
MTSRIPQNSSTWLVDWSPVTIMVKDDENQPDEPAVVREPDDE